MGLRFRPLHPNWNFNLISQFAQLPTTKNIWGWVPGWAWNLNYWLSCFAQEPNISKSGTEPQTHLTTEQSEASLLVKCAVLSNLDGPKTSANTYIAFALLVGTWSTIPVEMGAWPESTTHLYCCLALTHSTTEWLMPSLASYTSAVFSIAHSPLHLLPVYTYEELQILVFCSSCSCYLSVVLLFHQRCMPAVAASAHH